MIMYNFTRSGQVTPNEYMLLGIIDSFSGESHLKVAKYAEIMGKSTRTIKRIIRSLKDKGLIAVRHGLYKSIHLSIDAAKGVAWKINQGKNWLFSKGPKWTSKRDKKVTSNIEDNKEKNILKLKSSFLGENSQTEHPGGREIPIPEEFKGIWERLLNKTV